MKSFLKSLVTRALAPFKAFPTTATEPAELRRLLKRIRPYETEHELIRLGPGSDGGYLVPDDLEGIEALYSPGVDVESGFELECAHRGLRVFMADASVVEPGAQHPAFHFVRRFVGALTNAEMMTLDAWVESTEESSHGDLILQMDIEGSEYEVLLNLSEDLQSRFRIFVIEFHGLHWLWSKPFFDLASRAIDKLLQTHVCVHNHPNDFNDIYRLWGIELPLATELTFLRRDRIAEMTPADHFPHPLDRPNSAGNQLALPECWYRF